MTTNICRAYKLITEGQGTAKKGVFEVAELPQRTHLLVSFTNADLPSGVGVLLDRELTRGLVKIFQEFEYRMNGVLLEGGTRSITLPDSDTRADDDSSAF